MCTRLLLEAEGALLVLPAPESRESDPERKNVMGLISKHFNCSSSA